MPEIEQATAAPGEKRPVRVQQYPKSGWCRICGVKAWDEDLHAAWHAEHG